MFDHVYESAAAASFIEDQEANSARNISGASNSTDESKSQQLHSPTEVEKSKPKFLRLSLQQLAEKVFQMISGDALQMTHEMVIEKLGPQVIDSWNHFFGQDQWTRSFFA